MVNISINKAQESFDQYTDGIYCGQAELCYSSEPCVKKCKLLKEFIANYSKTAKEG